METTTYWNNANQTEPVKMQTILVVYEGSVWPGVYANGKVNLYPEDFGAVQLSECFAWAALPYAPELIETI